MRIPAVVLAALLAALAPGANAELMIGAQPPSGAQTWPLHQFAKDAQGEATPLRILGAVPGRMHDPVFGYFEPLEGVIYVSNFFGQSIEVYPAFASGTTAPLRVIDPPVLGQTRSLVALPAQGELIAAAGNMCCIFTFPLLANGSDVVPIRRIDYGGMPGTLSQLVNPNSLIHLPGTDELAVTDYDNAPPYAGKIVFHARTSNGNVAPTRVLKSDYTENAAGIAHDPARHRLFVLSSHYRDDGSQVGRINVFAENAANDDAPLYSIEGAATRLDLALQEYFGGITLDRGLDRIFVSVTSQGAGDEYGRVLGFNAVVTGNAEPAQLIDGTAVGNVSIGAPFVVPVDALFADGFEP